MLIDAGADPNARNPGKRYAETPLRWAASSDDVDVASALIDGGADLEELLTGQPAPEPEAISQAFWRACAGGQRRAAEYLLARGADLNWVPEYNASVWLSLAKPRAALPQLSAMQTRRLFPSTPTG